MSVPGLASPTDGCKVRCVYCICSFIHFLSSPHPPTPHLGHDQLSRVLSYAITVGTSFADIQLSFLWNSRIKDCNVFSHFGRTEVNETQGYVIICHRQIACPHQNGTKWLSIFQQLICCWTKFMFLRILCLVWTGQRQWKVNKVSTSRNAIWQIDIWNL